MEQHFTKYETARIIGARALQIAMDAPLLAKIKEENKQLEIAAAQHRAIYHFEGEKEKLDMKKPDVVGFIDIEVEESVAMNGIMDKNKN